MLGCKKKNIIYTLLLLITGIVSWESAATDGVDTNLLENWGISTNQQLKKREISPEEKRKTGERRRIADYKHKQFQPFRHQRKAPKITWRSSNLPQIITNNDYNPGDDNFNEDDPTISTLETITDDTQLDEANELMANHLKNLAPAKNSDEDNFFDEDSSDELDGFIGSFLGLKVGNKRDKA